MTLPIDPKALTDDDIGEKRATLAMAHDEAVEHVRGAFDEAGFGFPVEFSPSTLLNEKVGAGRDPYTFLGACNPEIADRALDASDGRIGALMPCGVVVWEDEPSRQTVYHVSIMRMARLTGTAPDDGAWADIIASTGALVDDAWARLDAAE